LARQQEPAWSRSGQPDEEERRDGPVVTTPVNVAAWLGRRRDALIAHATQLDLNSHWPVVSDEVIAEVYASWEDHTLPGPWCRPTTGRTDLFAGLDGTATSWRREAAGRDSSI
jgi:hypothetical protein